MGQVVRDVQSTRQVLVNGVQRERGTSQKSQEYNYLLRANNESTSFEILSGGCCCCTSVRAMRRSSGEETGVLSLARPCFSEVRWV